jgi:hypothetical protein
MGFDVIRPAFNPEPKFRVTVLTRVKWTRGPGTHPVVKGFVWFTDGSGTTQGTGAGVYGQSVGRRLSISLGKFSRLRYMPSWPVYMKFKRMLGQRNMLVFALIVRRL